MLITFVVPPESIDVVQRRRVTMYVHIMWFLKQLLTHVHLVSSWRGYMLDRSCLYLGRLSSSQGPNKNPKFH